jgi:TRAP-type C4-dicarboxylate transport system permease small subunit
MRYFIRLIELIVVVLMGTVTVLVVAEVFLRGLASTSLIITDELSRYLMIWTALLAAALVVDEDGHVRTTIVTDALPPRAALISHLLADVLVLCFLGIVVVYSVTLMVAVREQHTVTLGISMFWFYAAMPVCAALMFFLTARALLLRLLGWRSRAAGS